MRKALLLGALGVLVAALWWRRNPSACPYNQRFWVQAPHPFITRARLLEALALSPGERVLEIGPGTGYYTFDIAAALPAGQVDVFDIQQEMLDHVMREAERRGVTNVRSTLGDAQNLPFDDDAFDAATVGFGVRNVEDLDAALAELRRVLRPGGRLAILEITQPRGVLRPFFSLWFDHVVPLLGKVLPGGRAYTYLPASVRRFPGAEELAAVLERHGFGEVRFRLLGGTIVALHTGVSS
jgi:ubiquinone/menaquinone biosynthesis methyltransferase